MTTLPRRLDDIVKPVKSILKQTAPLQLLYLNIPKCTKQGELYNIPKNFLNQFNGYNTKVLVNRCIDYGPITKLAPTLDLETNPSTYILTFDDDIIVHRDLVKVMKNRIKINPNICWAFSGICVGKFPFYFQFVINNEKDQCVDWIQGVHVVAYRRSFFTTCKDLVQFRDTTPIADILVNNDDHHISLYLARLGILRVSIGKNIRDFLFNYKTGQEDALSARTNLLKEHYNIIKYALKKGYYGTSYSISTSVVYILLISICTTIFTSFLLPKRLRIYLFIPLTIVITIAMTKYITSKMVLLQYTPLRLSPPQN
jgi:hypothetical protein